jgi:hypothetical protein
MKITAAVPFLLLCLTVFPAAASGANAAPDPSVKNAAERSSDSEFPFDIDLYPSLEFGGYVDPSFTRWAHKRIQRYFTELKALGPPYAGYSLEHRYGHSRVDKDEQSASFGGIGFGLAGDFYCGNFGFGVWLHSLIDIERTTGSCSVVKDSAGNDLYQITFDSFYNDVSFSFYYRIPIPSGGWCGNAEKVFVRIGTGPDIAYTYYYFEVTLYHSDEPAALHDDFYVNCRIRRFGWHSNVSLMAEHGLLFCGFTAYYSYMSRTNTSVSGTARGVDGSAIGNAHEFSLSFGIGFHFQRNQRNE